MFQYTPQVGILAINLTQEHKRGSTKDRDAAALGLTVENRELRRWLGVGL